MALVLCRQRRRRQVKDFLRDYYIRYSGPAGMTEQDDMENWNYAHAASRGMIARRYPYNYEKGSARGRELRMGRVPHAGPGHRPDPAQSSETIMRNLYRRWAQFMEADSWDELMTWRRTPITRGSSGAQAAK